ncbi:MAG: aldose 1-epimerase family protein [Oscillospiraceae bacterium]|nr:aldose 1-epimerase family protein [Oscillospiraceae bacterium]
MEIILENNILALTVNTLGAELVSVQKKETGEELLWDAREGGWNRHAPILFPWCGRLKNGKFTYNGTEYEGAGHGFARDLEHTVTEQTDTSITLTLAANAVTMEKYPFVFRLVTTYTLQGTAVRHDVRVENEGDWDMPFALGFHPGFMCPFDCEHQTEDYELRFDTPQTPVVVDTGDGGLVSGKEYTYFTNESVIPLTDTLFANDSLCFKNLTAKTMTLQEKGTGRSITVDVAGFPFVLIWSQAGPLEFVCIEPWHGVPDRSDATGNWADKPHTITLAKGEDWGTQLVMQFNR